VAAEAASKDADLLHKGGNINKLNSAPRRTRNYAQQQSQPNPGNQYKPGKANYQQGQRTTCYRCGDSHLANTCKFKSYKCNYCKRVGHLAKVCRSKQTTNYIEQNSEEVEDTETPESYLHTLGMHNVPTTNGCSNPVEITVNIDGKDIAMEVDTGAAMSIVPQDVYQSKLSHLELSECTYNFTTYGGNKLPVLGQGEVTVQYESQTVKLPIVVAN
jgi:hypothetical protein